MIIIIKIIDSPQLQYATRLPEKGTIRKKKFSSTPGSQWRWSSLKISPTKEKSTLERFKSCLCDHQNNLQSVLFKRDVVLIQILINSMKEDDLLTPRLPNRFFLPTFPSFWTMLTLLEYFQCCPTHNNGQVDKYVKFKPHKSAHIEK